MQELLDPIGSGGRAITRRFLVLGNELLINEEDVLIERKVAEILARFAQKDILAEGAGCAVAGLFPAREVVVDTVLVELVFAFKLAGENCVTFDACQHSITAIFKRAER